MDKVPLDCAGEAPKEWQEQQIADDDCLDDRNPDSDVEESNESNKASYETLNSDQRKDNDDYFNNKVDANKNPNKLDKENQDDNSVIDDDMNKMNRIVRFGSVCLFIFSILFYF